MCLMAYTVTHTSHYLKLTTSCGCTISAVRSNGVDVQHLLQVTFEDVVT